MGFWNSEEKTESRLPEANRETIRVLLNRAVNQAATGFMPYTGDQVAGFDPRQMAAMQNTDAAASAFGLGSAPVNFGMGNRGSIGLYDQAMQQAQERAPGQMDYYNSFFINPQTGVPGSRTSPYEYIGQKPPGFGSYTPGVTGPYGGGYSQQAQPTYYGGQGGQYQMSPTHQRLAGNWRDE